MTEYIKCDKCGQLYERNRDNDISRIEVYRPGYRYLERHYCPECIKSVASLLGIRFEKEREDYPCDCPVCKGE